MKKIINPEWETAPYEISFDPPGVIHRGPPPMKPNPEYKTPDNGQVVGWHWGPDGFYELVYVNGEVFYVNGEVVKRHPSERNSTAGQRQERGRKSARRSEGSAAAP